MAKFDPIHMQYASLKRGEKHLHSFSGQTCEWETNQKYFLFGEVTGFFPQVTTIVLYYRGHITNRRWILEMPPKVNPLVMGIIKILGEAIGTRVGQIVGVMSEGAIHTSDEVERMLEKKKYLEIPLKDIEKVVCYSPGIFWAVAKGDPIGLGVPFVPRYIDKDGNPTSGSLFSNDNDVEEFSTIVSSLLKLEHTDDSIKI